MNLICRGTIAEAWLEACKHLRDLPGGLWRDTTVVLHVSEPSRVSRADRAMTRELDEFLVSHGCYTSHTVAETIFPGDLYRRGGSEAVYETYPEQVYPRIQKRTDTRAWGTYAHRLLRRTDSKGKEYNPLKDCLAKMKQKSPMPAAYELGLGFEAQVYDDDRDRRRRMPLPCLSHVSFKLIDKTVHLTALYRSHWYVQRAYGNLLGLARLQAFVANELGIGVGPLACHSTFAKLELEGSPRWGKRDVRALLERCDHSRGNVRSSPAATSLEGG